MQSALFPALLVGGIEAISTFTALEHLRERATLGSLGHLERLFRGAVAEREVNELVVRGELRLEEACSPERGSGDLVPKSFDQRNGLEENGPSGLGAAEAPARDSAQGLGLPQRFELVELLRDFGRPPREVERVVVTPRRNPERREAVQRLDDTPLVFQLFSRIARRSLQQFFRFLWTPSGGCRLPECVEVRRH